MSGDLSELYQQVILDHNRNPRNYGPLPGASHRAEGHNPLCGDQFTVSVRLEGEVLDDVRFEGSGCAISRASASLMTTMVKGRPRSEVEELRQRFQVLVTSDPHAEPDTGSLGKLGALGGVRAFPARIKCATLPWHTLRAALQGTDQVTTE